MFDKNCPAIVQSDRTILLATDGPRYPEARDFLANFAELVKSPDKIHTYKITPLSLWNAAASGHGPKGLIDKLKGLTAFEIPQNVEADIEEYMQRYGQLRLSKADDGSILLEATKAVLIEEILHNKEAIPLVEERLGPTQLKIVPAERGSLKQVLIKMGRPVADYAGYVQGDALNVELREETNSGEPFGLRDYQKNAVEAFYAGGSDLGGSGIVALPCGSGKTIIGLGAMAAVGAKTLILTANNTAVRQWRDEIINKTSLTPDEVGLYSGASKEICPVTITTYQMLTHRRRKSDGFTHMPLFEKQDWGLIIYDEVHLLPAPVFRATSSIQSRRRLGLTATLIREDGKEEDVFALIGPKKFDAPWRDLERQGWIATATCIEMRVPFSNESHRMNYAASDRRDKFRIAATNPAKLKLARQLATRHSEDHILFIGQYLDQLEEASTVLEAPLITGKTPQDKRNELYDQFKKGKIPRLVVSKVANFAVDLPDANVAIQLSGTFGSRQEEAQRLGRVLRPKKDSKQATFYTLVTRDTIELDFAAKRQLFLTEQGYRYEIESF